MTAIQTWIINSGKAIDFGEITDLIGPVADFAERWEDVGRGLIELGKAGANISTPAGLLSFVLDNLSDGDVTSVLDAIDETLSPRLVQIKADYQKSQWSKLLEPVEDLQEAYLPKTDETVPFNRGTDEGLIELAIPKKTASGAANLGKLDLTFGVSAAAALELEAGALWPFESDKVAPGLLRLGARGELGVQAGAKAPISTWGSIGGKFEAEAKAELGYFYRPDPKSVFLNTVGPAFNGLVSPANLDTLASAISYNKLEGVVMLIEGSASGKAELDLGQSLALGDVGLKLGLTGSVRYARQSQWALSLRKVPAGYNVVLSRLKAREDGWSVGAGLTVDVSELAQKANQALDQVTDFTGPALKEIKPFLSPGTYALEKLEKPLDKAVDQLLKDSALAAALKQDLGLLLGNEPGDSLALESALKDKLTASLDEVTGGVTRAVSDFTDETIAALVAKLPDIAVGNLQKKAKDEVGDLVEKLIDDFEDKAKDLVKTKGRTDKLAAELASIGAKVTSGAKKADNALAKVRELVAAYESYAKKARETLEKLAKTEIAIKLESSYSKSEAAHYEVLGTITKVNDQTEQLWHELALGRLPAVERMLLDPDLAPDGFVLSPQSSLTLTSQSVRGRALSIDALGEVFKVQVTASGKAEIRFQNGKITVEAMAEAKRLNASFGPTRTSSFLSVVELQQFKTGKDARSVDLAIEFLREDDKIKRKELDTFLKGLSENNLISQPRAEAARDLLQQTILGGRKVKGDIGFRLELSPQQLKRLLAIGKAATQYSEVEAALFKLAARMMIEVHNTDPLRMGRALEAFTGADDFEAQLDLYWADRLLLNNPGRWGGATSREWKIIRPLKTNRGLFEGLPAIFISLYETHAALPKTAFQEGWTIEDYREKQQEIADAAARWIKTKANIVSGELHPVMLTILHIFMALERGHLPSDRDGIVAFVDAMAAPFDTAAPTSMLQLTMQFGAAKEPTII